MITRASLALLVVSAVGVLPAAGAPTLSNGLIRAEFGPRGLVSLVDLGDGGAHRFLRDGFSITIDGAAIDSATLDEPSRRMERDRLTYSWALASQRLEVVYELRAGWRVLSKQILVTADGARFRVNAVSVFRATLAEPPTAAFVPSSNRRDLQTGDYGAALRFRDGRGLLTVVQNPFLQIDRAEGSFAVRYAPDMEWRREYGPFPSDRGLLAPYRLSGRRLPAAMRPEWTMAAPLAADGMDEAEVAAFTDLVRAFVLTRPEAPLNVFVGWCVNDYQIDTATPEGRSEYKRVMDRAAGLGAQYVLYAPSNSDVSRREESVDDWSWEHVLWLGLGQRIRRNAWDPQSSPIPPSIAEMLDYARSKQLKLLAYVYPVMPFSQNPEWLATRQGASGKQYGSLGVRSLQDWLIDTLVAFHQRTGIGGYAFDHTFLTFEGTSRYAQWWGWRRVMEELRRRVPDIVIDGRQAYHLYGPWSWLAGSYPHPTANDEQPESFMPFPDLHFDRVSANRERYTAYRYRNYEFAPIELVPGYATHQTSRSDDTGRMPETKSDRGVLLSSLRARDWDYLGWRYSLLSSIAVAGWNNVLNMIPARDEAEFHAFSEDDAAWFRGWLDWCRTHTEFLRDTRTILGEPGMGRVDGTSMISGNRGYFFLFNPNARTLTADFVLDDTVGLRAPGRFMLREMHPLEGRLIGKPGLGFWSRGDRVSLPMDGGSAVVLELLPAPGTIVEPMLFNAPGSVTIAGDTLEITGVRGEAGTSTDLTVALPATRTIARARVNGRDVPTVGPSSGMVSFAVRFAGEPFSHYQRVGPDARDFAGGRFSARVTIPRRIFDQLAARQRAWPIPWTAEDYRATWLVPERLLLFVQIAEPDERWEASLLIDGRPAELRKAYSAIRREPSTFVGFYADVSLLSADQAHTVELRLPPLAPGQFQGLFFENVETEYTSAIAP